MKRIAVSFAIVASLAYVLLPHAATPETTSEREAAWGNRALSYAYGSRVEAIASTANDFFADAALDGSHRRVLARRLATGGTRLETAGSGSWWIYDRVNHIAAASEGGDVTGDSVFLYDHAPPYPIVDRDLSHVVSRRGLRLGISPLRAATILGVSPNVVRRTSKTDAVLYLRTPRICSPYRCAHDETLVFHNGAAVAITLVDLGP